MDQWIGIITIYQIAHRTALFVWLLSDLFALLVSRTSCRYLVIIYLRVYVILLVFLFS